MAEKMSLRPTTERIRASELGICSDHALAKLFDLTMNERKSNLQKMFGRFSH